MIASAERSRAERLARMTPEEHAEDERKARAIFDGVIKGMAETNREHNPTTEEKPKLKPETAKAIKTWAAAHYCFAPTVTLLQIWEDGSEKALLKMEKEETLMPFLKSLESGLSQAQHLRAEPANQMLPMYEILQMVEMPLLL